ncbi:hypothetical protein MO867_09315 [Microbulbifer sp. OS29]|uniref:Uncharacterized protein n=1 Tax=Microbulbifer okhotskensis TaxID=2926617 RepID=A0A9X2ERR5_9GAMM|nr:hypothetical protein [Microbulbifer okhotskensis]MCO1334536.1 hypothetical protein [Microbulbifer okhotskensis]
MPAGRGRQCEGCYWAFLVEKKITINGALLECVDIKNLFEEYIYWLCDRSGHKKAALSIAKDVLFFRCIEKKWINIPSYTDLLTFFGAGELRRFINIVKWLSESGYIAIDSVEKNKITEEQRIVRILKRLQPGSVASEVVLKYEKNLRSKLANGKLTLLTIRLSLSAATGLMLEQFASNDTLPSKESLVKYLSQRPGQLATISVFIRFLNKEMGHDLTCESTELKKIVDKKRKIILENKLSRLSRKKWTKNDLYQWVKITLEYFHDQKCIRKKDLLGLEDFVLSSKKDLYVILGGKKYYIPLPSFGGT